MTAITKTNGWLNLLRDDTAGVDLATITWVAVGTGSTAPAATDTTLVSESFRKATTSHTNPATGETIVSVYIGPSDAVGVVIAEVGFFGGDSATSAANSGVLVARGLWSHTKTNTESLVLKIDATFS